VKQSYFRWLDFHHARTLIAKEVESPRDHAWETREATKFFAM
jgi:hypothetical protein